MRVVLKRFVLFMLCLSINITINHTVYATTSSIAEAVSTIKTLDMLKGDSTEGVTQSYINSVPTRYQAFVMVLRLKGLESEMLSFNYLGKETFSDAKGTGNYIERLLAYAKSNPELGWVGYNNKFNPLEQISTQEYLKVLLEALGYKQDIDFKWEDTLNFAELKGLVQESISFSIGSLAQLTVDALKSPTKDGRVLIDILADKNESLKSKAITAELIGSQLKVDTVSALNARQILINFNKEFDGSSIDEESLKIYINNSGVPIPYTYTTVGRSLFIGLTGSMAQNSTATIKINHIKSLEVSDEIVNLIENIVVKDNTMPKVLDVTPISSKSIKIKTTEPLLVTSTSLSIHQLQFVSIDGVKLIAKLIPNYLDSSVIVEFSSTLSVGKHSVEISGYTDIVGNKGEKYEGSFEILQDFNSPEIISTTMIDRRTLKIEFDDAIQNIGDIYVDNIHIGTYSLSSDRKNVTAQLGVPLSISSLVESTIKYINTSDMSGNTITAENKYYKFKADDDKVVPTAEVVFTPENKIRIIFSEKVSTPGVIQVRNSKNELVINNSVPTVNLTLSTKGLIYELATGFVDKGTYTISIVGALDDGVRTNAMVAKSYTLLSNDTIAPYISDVILTKAYQIGPPVVYGQVTIFFSEEMDESSLLDNKNYIVDLDGSGPLSGTTLNYISGATIAIGSDSKSVILTIPDSRLVGGIAAGNGITNISALALKDKAGVYLAAGDFNIAKHVKSSASTLTASNIKAIDTNKLQITFSNAMSIIEPTEIKLYRNDGITLGLIGISYTLDSTKKIATITLNSNLTTDGKIDSSDTGRTKIVIGTTNTRDIYNGYVTGGTKIDQVSVGTPAFIVVADAIVPKIQTITTGTADHTIDIIFTEIVNSINTTELNNDLIITDENGVVQVPTYTFGDGFGSVTNYKVLTVHIPNSSGKLYNIQFVGRSTVDSQVNVAQSYGPISVRAKVDTSLPTIISSETQDLNSNGYIDALKITFSESILDSSIHITDFDVVGYLGENYVFNTNGDIANNNVIYITLTEGVSPDTSAVPLLNYTKGFITDLSLNYLSSQSLLSIDKALPQIVQAIGQGTITIGNTLQLSISENISNTAAVLTAIHGARIISDVGSTPISYTEIWTTNKQLDISLIGDISDGDQITYNSVTSNLIDLSGNTTINASVVN